MSYAVTIEYVRSLGGRSFSIAESESVSYRWLVKVYPGSNWSNRKLPTSMLYAYARQWQEVTGSGPPIPKYHDPNFEHPDFYCRSLSATQEAESPLHWVIEATYDDAVTPVETIQRGTTQRAVDRPWRWSANTRTVREPLIRDKTGRLITNSARDPFDPPIEWDVVYPSLVGRHSEVFPGIWFNYAGAVNDDQFEALGYLFQPKTLKIMGIDIGEEVEDGGEKVYPVSITLETASGVPFGGEGSPGYPTWDVRPLDQGLREGFVNSGQDPAPGVPLGRWVQRPIQMVNEQGTFENVSEPVLLDGSGRQLIPTNPIGHEDGDGVFLTVDVLNLVSFTNLFAT